MATINELGRNSASISYGPFTTGQDFWPALALTDQWMRNDTWQGYAVASGTTLTGTGTIWNTQARAGDTIMVAGQQRVVASITSDTSITVTQAFSPAITLPSAVKVINVTTYTNNTNAANTVAAGYVQGIIRNNTNGTVAVNTITTTSQTVTGTGTYFLAECTNAVSLVTVAGTVAIDAYGNITGTSTQFLSQQGGSAGLYPGDSIAVLVGTAGQQVTYYFQIATVTSDTAATTVLVPQYGAISAGAAISKATNGVSGRIININGRIRTVTAIASNTSMTVSPAMDFTDSNLRYKTYPRGTIFNTIGGTVIGTTAGSIATNVFTSAATQTGFIIPGCAITGVNITAGTLITGQITAVGSPATTQTASGTSGTNILTLSATNAAVLPGHFVAGATGVQLAGVAADTYVVSVSGTTVTLSRALTGNVTAATVNFWLAGGTGTYSTNSVTTTAASAQVNFSTVYGVGTNFAWDLQAGDQVWIGDELRTLNFANSGAYSSTLQPQTLVPITFTGATGGQGAALSGFTLDYIGYTGVANHRINQLITTTGQQFRRDESYLIGNTTNFATDLRVSDDCIMEGTEFTIQSLPTASNMKISSDFTHTTALSGLAATTTLTAQPAAGQNVIAVTSATGIAIGQYVSGPGIAPGTLVTGINSLNITIGSNVVALGSTSANYTFYNGAILYKKKKLHGYVLEGTREGFATNQKFSTPTTTVTTAGSGLTLGSTTLTTAATLGTNPYLIVKIQNAGGTPIQLTGQIVAISASTTVVGVNTLFTTQLHIGAEVCIAGQYVHVTAIASDTSFTASATMTTVGTNPIYRTIPLYTYLASGTGTTWTLGHPVKNACYSNGANPPQVWVMSSTADFIEYVYSCTNNSAEQLPPVGTSPSWILSNQSLDRKYVGFRYYPLMNSTWFTTGTTTLTLSTSGGGYATPVYERWAAAYGQAGGVGVNLADTSAGTVVVGTQATTTFTLTTPVSGALVQGMTLPGATQPNVINTLASGTWGAAGSTYTMANSNTIAAGTVVHGMLGGAVDVTPMTHTTGGFIYMFASNRYMVLQGKSFSNQQTQWTGCIEFERAQPEDAGTGLGTTSPGIAYNTVPTGIVVNAITYYPINPVEGVISNVPGISPWPCYAYFNGNRFPTGASQIATLPAPSMTYAVHGSVLATPRVRNSAGDLVGSNAHVYSAMTITTGRWGHLWELAATGAYASVAVPVTGVLTNIAHTVLQPHMGQIVPVYTNVYNSKRFMFSPVVVLGPSYDPDVRGRLYGVKVIPSALGTLMDTVSITVDNNWFYTTTTQTATDHWVITTPPTGPTTTVPNAYVVPTYRISFNNAVVQQQYRSLEDNGAQAVNLVNAFTNNFRWAIPA